MLGYLKTMVRWIFWSGTVPLIAIFITFPLYSCVMEGSFKPLSSIFVAGDNLGIGIVLIVSIVVSAFNMATTLVAGVANTIIRRIGLFPSYYSQSSRRQIVETAFTGFVSPFIATLLSGLVMVSRGSWLALVNLTRQGIFFALSTLIITLSIHALLKLVRGRIATSKTNEQKSN